MATTSCIMEKLTFLHRQTAEIYYSLIYDDFSPREYYSQEWSRRNAGDFLFIKLQVR